MPNALNLDNGGEKFNICLEADGNLNFKANSENCEGDIRITINDDNGNVGIGTTTPRNPLAIRGQGSWEELISFEDPQGTTKWHINQNIAGGNPGLNFVETGVADGRLFIQAGGNIGIGVTSPNRPLTIKAAGTGEELISFNAPDGTTKWHINQNLGGSNPGLNFVESGIADGRLFLQAGGNVGIGTTNPRNPLAIRGQGSWEELISFEDPQGTTKWHINQNIAGGNPGLNFVESGVADGRLFIQAGGNVGIGTTNPSQTLHVQGNICYTGSIGACSDLRYKTEIEPLENSLNKVLSMQGMRYHWNQAAFPNHGFGEEPQIGFSSQDVEAICPEVVTTDSEGYKYLDYSRLTPVLVEAIKEQQQLIEQQKSALGEALAKIAQLEVAVQEMSGDS